MRIQTLKAETEKKSEHGNQLHDKPPVRIVRMRDLISRIGLSRTTIYLAVKEGKFPAPISLGARAVGWLESQVDEWIASRVKAGQSGTDE